MRKDLVVALVCFVIAAFLLFVVLTGCAGRRPMPDAVCRTCQGPRPINPDAGP